MGLSRSTFYDALPAPFALSELLARISAICDEFECYGLGSSGRSTTSKDCILRWAISALCSSRSNRPSRRSKQPREAVHRQGCTPERGKTSVKSPPRPDFGIEGFGDHFDSSPRVGQAGTPTCRQICSPAAPSKSEMPNAPRSAGLLAPCSWLRGSDEGRGRGGLGGKRLPALGGAPGVKTATSLRDALPSAGDTSQSVLTPAGSCEPY
jgi:hypothetical protein